MKTHLQRSMALAAILVLGVGRVLSFADSASAPLYLYLSGANNQQLSWSSVVGARYTVQASTDLAAWHDVVVVTATGATLPATRRELIATRPAMSCS